MTTDLDASPPIVDSKAEAAAETARRRNRIDREHPNYKWVALSNTTLGALLAAINSSIVLISLPAIFRGIGLNPLAPGNVSYLLWMLMGYLVATAVLVVPLGRLGDIFGRVRIYNLGFVVFTVGAIALSFDPFHLGGGAVWLIGWRVFQGIGGAMLMACSAAILTDAFPAHQRGMALGVNQVAAIAGQFLGLLIGGVLSEWDWRAVFWVGVPLGLAGTIWSYRSLREVGVRTPARFDWPGTLLFGIGLTVLLAAITYGIQPYGGHSTGWTNPVVLGAIGAAAALLALLCLVEMRVRAPMMDIRLFQSKPFALGNLAGLMSAVGRGGLQFMLIIWLQGIWLPLHGYSFESTPLWSGIYMLPMTVGFLVAGPLSGTLSDRLGSRPFAVGGLALMGATFIALVLIPVNFDYRLFAVLIFLNGLGGGIFTSPNTAAIMSSVPAAERGAASGIRATFTNAGMSLSIGTFFSLMIAGLAHSLPAALSSGLQQQGVAAGVAHQIADLPPVGSLFAAFLGYNPIAELLQSSGALHQPGVDAATLTGKSFFPHLISGPFHAGLVVVFTAAAVMMVIGAAASWVNPGRSAGDA
ncbi:MFS transporter [Mycobacterium sp. ACS1612]|uniref:MFS transporter n=1 Tax=Mycobacterium sp. ACS1612 TaxID=1834117 RepID=UPI000B05449A|nr:MFS transporter [Mycobacterium sp. ACS1612]